MALQPPPRKITEFSIEWKDWLYFFWALVNPYFDGNGGLTTSGTRIKNTSRYTTTQTIPVTDEVVFCNTDAGDWTATLSAGIEGASQKIINSGTSENTLTLSPDGAELLLGANSTFELYDGETLELTYSTIDGWL
jgi:hypothetical protein